MLKLLDYFGKVSKDDLYNTCSFLLKSKNILYSYLHLKSLLTEHINYPSLLAIQDALLEYGVASLALTKGDYSYHDFEFPFICAIQKQEWSHSAITIVTNVENNKVHYLDPTKNELAITTLESFQSMDTGSIMLIDMSNGVNEKNFRRNLAKERQQTILAIMPLIIIIISILSCGIYIIRHFIRDQSWSSIAYLVTTLTGVFISLFLISYEIDRDNKLLKQVCGNAGKNLNCVSVLSSAHSVGFGVSWTIWGGAYFGMIFLIQLLFANNLSFLTVTAALSILVAPFILYSIYVQWRIIKQWCLLCLGIQALLVINAFIGICVFTQQSIIVYEHHILQTHALTTTLLIGASLFITILILVPIVKIARDSKAFERKLQVLKSDKSIFFYFLKKGNSVKYPPVNMGITLGNPSAANELIVVCNPYCRYCAILHPKLNRLLRENTDVQIRILFLVSATNDALDRRVVAQFFKIHKKYGIEKVQSAMDYWYNNLTINVNSFADRYMVNNESDEDDGKIEEMSNWINSIKIRVTPTLLFNGYKVPILYDMEDLIEILKFSK